MNGLTCPKCRKSFMNVTIEREEGTVNCPKCGHVMFQYRFPGDETLTPEAFMRLRDGKRGEEAARQTLKFLVGKKNAMPTAGALVAFLWIHLAKTFEDKPEPST